MNARVGTAALAALLLACATPAMSPDEAQAWRGDLRFMAAEMERTHKNLYHAVSREQFTAMVAALDVKIPSLQRAEVIVEMARIVAAVGDGHTNIYPTRDPKIGFHTLPVAFTFFGEELYVRAARKSEQPLVGARVLRIGDRAITDAYASVKTMIGCDNDQGSRYWAQYLLAMPEVLHALGITRSLEDVRLTLMTSHGEENVVLHSFVPVEIMSGDTATLFNRREGWIDARDRSGRPDPLWLRGSGDAFHFEHAGSLLYVQINRIGDKTDETLAHFARHVREEIAATKPEKVAIDLRLNRGGDGTLNVPVIRALIQSVSIDRKGHLFAIIGPATFSAAQMLVDGLEEYTNVTFVGESTGAKGNTFGDSRKIVLPNSGITVRASIFYWQDWHPMDRRDATIPQISAPLTFDAYCNNVDPAIEAIERAKPVESDR
jgi:hypothetical protein